MKPKPRFKIGEFVRLSDHSLRVPRVVYPYYGDMLNTAKPVQASREWVFEVKRYHDSGQCLIVGGVIGQHDAQVLGGWFYDDDLEPATMKDEIK